VLSRRGGCVGVMTLAALLAAASCSSPKSFIVLRLRSSTAGPIAGVTEIGVVVTQGTPSQTQTLTYPPPKGATIIAINQVTVTDLSVSFTGGRSGSVMFTVTARNAAGCEVGRGSKTTIIKKGDIALETVDLVASSCTSVDGGVDAEVDAFAGCDPVDPACGIGKTCQVNCVTKMGECTPGGSGAPGTPCQMNKDCMPGTQCFDYAGTGCAVKLCLRFCNGDLGCAAGSGGDGGASDGGAQGGAAVGTKSLCAGPVQCAGGPTAYHTCTFACDPRESALKPDTSGCPAGLSCLVVGNMDQVDCACAEKTRVGTDGTNCTGSAACAPGFICNMMGPTQQCRAVCRCDAVGMTCTAPNTCGDKTCSALTNDTTFGACL
jgi:hypothetical protein